MGKTGRATRGGTTSELRFEVQHDVSLDDWQDVADHCSYATFFHTPLWSQVFAESDPAYRIAARKYVFADGLSAVLPLAKRHRLAGLYSTMESTVAACYGGWISKSPLPHSHALAILDDLLSSCSNLAWRINPLDPAASLLADYATIPDTTETLDLSSFSTREELFKHYRHSARKQINKGCRAGLSARVAEGWGEWKDYYSLYERRLQEWGKGATSSYPISLFRALHDSRSPSVALWIVEKNGAIVGGNLNFYHGRHCVEWHAAYDCNLLNCGIRNYLVDQIIQNARERGYACYDFNPSGGHEGARRFKQTFNTQTVSSSLIIARHGVYRLKALKRIKR